MGHEVVNHPGIALGVAVDGGKGGGVDDGIGATGAGDLEMLDGTLSNISRERYKTYICCGAPFT